MGVDATRWGWVREVAAAAVIVAVGIGWRALTGTLEADAKPPQAVEPPPPGAKPVAIVNGVEITSDDLAAECLARHGTSVLETLVNRRIIEQACQRAGITISPQDVSAEIDGLARRFKVPRDKWLEMIQQERGIMPQQYADDIVWPMLALRSLARGASEPTDDELRQAFENRFGPAVKARIIVSRTRPDAEAVRKQALAAPDEFGALARQHSVDVGSASANGWVHPIRMHSGDPGFDRVALGLEEGAISDVVQVADQFIVIKCEGRLPGSGAKPEEVRPHLAEELRERKSRQVSSEVFKKLQDATAVENVMNDPAKAAARPGVATLVNGQPVSIEDVKAACLARHGRDVVEVLVTRRIVEQALAKQQQAVSQADLDAEIARAAAQMGFTRADGSPDTGAWLDRVTREEKVPLRHYLEDVVWPTVALKKLVGSVPVSQEDLDKAFAATFGPRARCRIIVLDNQRRAQEVWQMARQNPTAEHIGALAETYSADPTTRSLRGEVPSIQRWGGQPTLEREAFALKPGELSGVVQVADRFMVIFCEGFTEPAKVTFQDVRNELFDDIFEKKQRIEMARHFTHLRESASIDNFLAGTSQSPTQPGRGRRPDADMPATTLSRAEAADLARPRAGSVKAAADGVVPAAHQAPAVSSP
ncbi:MAG: peptidylprolyl isomerase [Planctomycetaceae bacterium]